jgi:putative alpha-1,2-mannosidase
MKLLSAAGAHLLVGAAPIAVAVSLAGAAPLLVEDLVDPFIGTRYEVKNEHLGACMPGPCLPHASIYPSPETLEPLPSGYRPDQPIVGFAQLHTQGTGGNPSYGNFLVTPRRGLAVTEPEHASAKSREDARAYAYRVHLERDNIDAEVVPTQHCALYRFAFPDADDSHVMIDVARKIGGALGLDEGSVQVDPVNGYVSGGGVFSHNWSPAPYRLFFAGRLSVAPTAVGTWVDQDINPGAMRAAVRGRPLGAFLRFKTTAGQPVLFKIAVSFTSAEQAGRWLDAEIPAWDFDGLRTAAAAVWRKELGAISLAGARRMSSAGSTPRCGTRSFNPVTAPVTCRVTTRRSRCGMTTTPCGTPGRRYFPSWPLFGRMSCATTSTPSFSGIGAIQTASWRRPSSRDESSAWARAATKSIT